MNEVEGVTVTYKDGTKKFIECIPGLTSDSFHTINELYSHRCLLFIAVMNMYPSNAWKSRKHSDGSEWDGWFIAGLFKSHGEQITYHLPDKYWNLLTKVETLEFAPEWDRHTAKDVEERLENVIKYFFSRMDFYTMNKV